MRILIAEDDFNVAAFLRERATSYEFEAIERLIESANGENRP